MVPVTPWQQSQSPPGHLVNSEVKSIIPATFMTFVPQRQIPQNVTVLCSDGPRHGKRDKGELHKKGISHSLPMRNTFAQEREGKQESPWVWSGQQCRHVYVSETEKGFTEGPSIGMNPCHVIWPCLQRGHILHGSGWHQQR